MQSSEKLPRIAAIVAFVDAGIVLLTSLFGPIVLLPAAIIPLFAGIGILRRRVWSAYGFAACLLAELLLVPVILFRPGPSTGLQAGRMIGTILLSLALAILFLLAGRSLAISGAPRGRAFPWIAVAALTVVPFFFIQNFEIPSAAMENTLLPGDRILARRFPLPPPERGEMVIFLSPQDRNVLLVKRVIAVPGDRLRISQKTVILNGTALDEKYALQKTDEPDLYQDVFSYESSLPGCTEGHGLLSEQTVNGEILVPAGKYFVLGDNREDSLDSRCWGFVASGDIVGKPLMIYDSIDQTSDQASSPSPNWLGHRRWRRLFTIL